MSVSYITGNLLDYPAGCTVIAHGTSRQGVLGAGIAKGIADEYPAACEPYFAAFADGKQPPLGSIIAGDVPGGKRLVHLVCQDQIGTERRQVDYEALLYCLERLHDLLLTAHREGRTWVLGLPWLGCGLAGGARGIVKALIEHVFGESPVKCVVVELPAKHPAVAQSVAAAKVIPFPTTDLTQATA